MRIFIAVRHRYAEDALANAVERGARQVVVLGAGLDTWAYRSPLAARVRVFEVDHPATQARKRECLSAAAISSPPSLTYAPIDFERQGLAEGLAEVNFDPAAQTFFTWLGVVPYLTEEAVWSTLGFIAGVPGGAHVVFDYADPPGALPEAQRAELMERAGRVAALGERWLSFFNPEDLQVRLSGMGFIAVEDVGPRQMAERYFQSRAADMPEKGGHILLASTV